MNAGQLGDGSNREWRPVHHPSRWPLTVKAELQQGNRSCCREAFVSEKESGGNVTKAVPNEYKSCGIGEGAAGTGSSTPLGVFEIFACVSHLAILA